MSWPPRRGRYFNPRSSCEERPGLLVLPTHPLQISIHAPHARSDLGYKRTMRHAGISIHAPHARSDRCRFLARLFSCNFNPRSSCEERPVAVDVLAACRGISIHAPHARSDLGRQKARSIASNFNPRSSCEERRDTLRAGQAPQSISIHAPHARSDLSKLTI